MAGFLKQHYGETEGPLGIPMLDQQAKGVDQALARLPKDALHEPGYLQVAKATTELRADKRCDISWISTEDVDHMHEIVLAKGMDDRHFQLNPVVTLQHAYWLPPVGRSLWRKKARQNGTQGIKAKTHYPIRPEQWHQEWPPDIALTLVQSGLLCGKSIGFLPTKVRQPTDEEIARYPEYRKVRRIVEKWLLLEYACVYLPAQPNAVVESVAKGLRSIPAHYQKALGLELEPKAQGIPFTSLKEIERHIQRKINRLDFSRITRRAR